MLNKEKEYIENEVLRTLHSLDGIQRAELNPFFYTRLRAKMDQQNSGWERVYSFISRPVIAIAILLVVMAVNTWTVWGTTNAEESNAAENNNTIISEIASEYNQVASTSNYDYEFINQ